MNQTGYEPYDIVNNQSATEGVAYAVVAGCAGLSSVLLILVLTPIVITLVIVWLTVENSLCDHHLQHL